MPQKFGQQDHRAERIAQTANWLKATPIDEHGDVIPVLTKSAMAEAIYEAKVIKAALASGVDRVNCAAIDDLTMAEMKKLLTEEEFCKVTFGGLNA